jgi:RND family efflux transporter MFP subunit
MKKILILVAVLALVACGKKNVEREESTIGVVVEKVAASENLAQMPYVGVVEEESSTSVSFTGMAMLKSMTVSEGQPVKKGQLLAVIDETQARNTLATTKAALDQAKDAYERMKLLHDNQSLPDMKWVEVESKVAQAQSAYDMAKKNLEDCRIYAPVSGVVGTKIMGVGETVLPTEPVLTILSIDNVKVRVSIPEREIATINSGTATTITVDALQGETFRGGRIEKGVSADPLTHTYDIRILVPNPGRKLLPGMVARVEMRNVENEKMSTGGRISLPVKAVQQSTDKSLFVWTVQQGKAHRSTVSVGQVTGNRIIVDSGLQEGDQVIVEGYQKVGEGTPVTYGME